MRPAPNPVQEVFREAMGIDAFALDGQDIDLAETWKDRAKRPVIVDA